MANPEQLPDYKRKQSLLHGKDVDSEKLVAVGKLQQKAGWYSDAIDSFAKADYHEGMEQLRQVAVAEGDLFLVRKILRATGAEGDEELWLELADNARRLGKLEFAREGYRLAGARKQLDEIDRLLNPPEAEEPVDAAYSEEDD